VCRRFPDKIERSRRGYHFIWYNLDIGFKKHLVYRKFIGDDWERVKLDINPKRAGQVLFTSKKVWIKRGNSWYPVIYCKICGTPLTSYFVFREGNFYCVKCGAKDVKVYEAVVKRREKLFLSFLSLFSEVVVQ